MENIFLLILVVCGLFFVSFLLAFIFDKGRNRLFAWIVMLFALAWVVVAYCLNNKLGRLHSETNAYSEINIAISLLGYYMLTLLFDAPDLFSDLHGTRLSQEGKVIKGVAQLGIVSFSPAFYWWQNDNDATLVCFFAKMGAVMSIGLLVIIIVAIITYKPNIFCNYLFKKYEIDEYIEDLKAKLSSNGAEIIKFIKANGFVSETDFPDKDSFYKGIKELVSYGVPMTMYTINSFRVYTYGDERDMDDGLYKKPISNPKMIRVNSLRYIASSSFVSDVSKKTGAKKNSVENKLSKLLQSNH